MRRDADGREAGRGTTAERRHRGAVTEFGFLLGSLGLLQGARFAYSLIVAASVPLAAFAQWGLLLAVLTYAPTLLVGSGNGMNRLVPLLRGRGDYAGADQVAEAAWTVAAVVTILLGVLAAILGALHLPLLAMVAVLAALVSLYQLQQFSLRSQMRFGAASVQQGMFGCAIAMGCVAQLMLRPEGLPVAVAVYAAAHLIAVLLGLVIAPPRFGRVLSGTVGHLVLQGAPIMLAGLLFGLLATLDRWVAALILGTSESAPYALASIVSAGILLVPTVVGQQTYPRMARRFGQEGDITGVTIMATSQNRTAALATLGPAMVMAVAAPIAIPIWLPAYTGAVAPLVVLGVAWCIYAAATGWANLLIVIGRQRTYLGIQAAVLATAPIALSIGATVGGLVGVSLGMLCVMSLYAALLRYGTKRSVADAYA